MCPQPARESNLNPVTFVVANIYRELLASSQPGPGARRGVLGAGVQPVAHLEHADIARVRGVAAQ